MKFGIPFFNRRQIEITQVNITYNTSTHSFNGLKAKGAFSYKLPFSNTESVPMRILKIELGAPFTLRRISYSLPKDVESGQRVVFEMKCEFEGDYAYSGPLNIKLMALPISSKLAKK